MKRKILSLALVLMMVLPLMTTMVFAANFTPTPQPITIHGSNSVNIVGETFEIYKIFDLDSYELLATSPSIDDERFAYRITPAFETFEQNFDLSSIPGIPSGINSLKDALEALRRSSGTLYGAIGSEAVLEANDESWAVPLTEALLNYIDTNTIAPYYTTGKADKDPFEINLADLGYYLIRSSHYNPDSIGDDGTYVDRVTAIAALRTNEVAVDIHCKADAPPIDKDVWDEKGEAWQGYTDANIGDTVWFKLTSKVPNMRGYATYNMTMYDELSAGLTLDVGSIVTYRASSLSPGTTPPAGAITVTASVTSTVNADGTTDITVDFGDIKSWYPDHVGDEIVVIYSATLNDNAVITEDNAIGIEGNPNKVWLEYSNNPYNLADKGKTREKKVTVFTFDIKVKKYFKTVDTPLADAVFSLYKAANFDTTTNTGIAENFIAQNTTAGQYKHALPSSTTTTELRSPADGNIDIIGLEEGEYYLVEIDAPKGYNLLEDPIKITISYKADGTKAVNWKVTELTRTYENEYDYVYGDIKGELTGSTDRIKIENKSGIKFPETGGIGTIIFYVIGGFLTVGTGLVLIVRSQMSKKKEKAEKAKVKQPGRAAI